jgi:hypothetical protein
MLIVTIYQYNKWANLNAVMICHLIITTYDTLLINILRRKGSPSKRYASPLEQKG